MQIIPLLLLIIIMIGRRIKKNGNVSNGISGING